jgi:hypothetical protein
MHRLPLSVALLLALSPAHAGRDASVSAYVQAVAATLPEPARGALVRIEDEPRRLLAERAYLRAGATLVRRWSWSDAQIAAFQRTAAHQAFLTEVARVQAKFARLNPGYALGAGTEVRSLDVQLQRWNANPSVGHVAARLHDDATAELRRATYPAIPTREAAARFAGFLQAWRPPAAPPLAAPGLSLHGQLRAVDFHVEKDGRLVASTEVASVRRVWEMQGWARKLREAIEGSKFVGPLASPNEPWHYEYVASTE